MRSSGRVANPLGALAAWREHNRLCGYGVSIPDLINAEARREEKGRFLAEAQRKEETQRAQRMWLLRRRRFVLIDGRDARGCDDAQLCRIDPLRSQRLSSSAPLRELTLNVVSRGV